MGLEDAAVGLMQAGHDDQLAARRDPMKGRRELLVDLENRFRGALEGLFGASARSRSADRTTPIGLRSIGIATDV